MSKDLMDKIITPQFRVSFPQVFEAKSLEGGKAKFSVVMIFAKSENITALKELAMRAVLKKYGSKDAIPKGFKTPFRDGNEKEYDGYKDTVFCTAASQYQPGVLDELKQPIINPTELYAGCYAVASINAYCWKYMGKEGVSFGLQNIMKVNDGESLAGGSSAEADFESIPLPDGVVGDGSEGGQESVLDIL